jgi:hypothetical protein
MTAQRNNDGTEVVRAKEKKNPCNDGLLHLPNRSSMECLPSQEEMLCLLVKGLPFVPTSPKQKEFEKAFRKAVANGRYPL